MGAEIVRVLNEVLGTSLSAGSLGVSIWAVQVSRGRDFLGRVKKHAGIGSDADLVTAVLSTEHRQTIFASALELSLDADWETRREVLARIAAETLTSKTWRLDEITLLLRTASELDRSDITVLTELSKPRPDRYEGSHFVGAAGEADIAENLERDTAHLLPPVLGTLATQGLLRDGALGAWDYGGPRWLLTPYAFRFLRRLLPATHFETATITVSLGSTRLHVRNLGYGDAHVTAVTATTDGRDLLRSAQERIALTAGEQVEVTCDTNFDPGAGARMRLTWTDDRGQESSVERYQNPR